MKIRYFTKFCGITNLKDALNAQTAGCNAIGFVFVKQSKRYISVKNCKYIIKHLSPALMTVALFANNSIEEIKETLNKCPIHVLQFHGDESPEFCQQWNKPYWKAIPMADDINVLDYANKYTDATGFLIDNYGKRKSGGSGEQFDWKKIPQNIDNKWILAGGLNPDNINFAKQNTDIQCFDVSSGIEVEPGVKSQTKMINFIKKLNT